MSLRFVGHRPTQLLKVKALATSECVNWFFGRGLSISCNLCWSVPTEWMGIPREEKIKRIRSTLRNEMNAPAVDSSVIQRFLRLLEQRTANKWKNRFITTNWDHLLQREIQALNLKVQPDWLANSHVFHLNGTIEELDDNSHRSPFLLEEDPATQRCFSPEANIVYNQMSLDQTFVVVGMSFECETDKFLLGALGRVEDDLPIGESTWVVVNCNSIAMERSCSMIANFLPRASVKRACLDFDTWLESGLPELKERGVIAF